MKTRHLLPVALLALSAAAAAASDVVTVSANQYPTVMESTVGDTKVKLALTGAAVRTKYFVNVYTVGSYAQQGVAVRTAEELAAKDCPKLLLLIMERDVKGADMAEATEKAIRANYPAPQFADEVKVMRESFARQDIRRSDRVWLTHVPGAGLRVTLEGKADVLIRNPQFSRAVWDIYLGKNNLGEDIKRGLVSR
jgi:hypothetical protein